MEQELLTLPKDMCSPIQNKNTHLPNSNGKGMKRTRTEAVENY
jgi:uncharacterized lipoprotein